MIALGLLLGAVLAGLVAEDAYVSIRGRNRPGWDGLLKRRCMGKPVLPWGRK